jgi:hypothetical protein
VLKGLGLASPALTLALLPYCPACCLPACVEKQKEKKELIRSNKIVIYLMLCPV